MWESERKFFRVPFFCGDERFQFHALLPDKPLLNNSKSFVKLKYLYKAMHTYKEELLVRPNCSIKLKNCFLSTKFVLL